MVTAIDKPKTIHDFGSFPEELYRQEYRAAGSPALADSIRESIKGFEIENNFRWGLDHGSWCFLKHMYPDADISVVQLSIDYTQDMQYHYDLGKSPGRNVQLCLNLQNIKQQLNCFWLIWLVMSSNLQEALGLHEQM